MKSIQITKKDFGFDIVCTIKDKQGQIVDLTTVTQARLKVVAIDTFRNVLDKEATVVNPPTNGIVKYSVQQNDFKETGNFQCSISLKYGSSKEISSEPFFISVDRSLS